MFGVFVVWTKTNRTFWLLHALLILTSLVFLTFPSVIECAYVFIAVSDSSTAGGFNFLKILDEARYAVDRVHKLVLFLFVVFHQKALSQLPDTMCNVLQHLNASDADIISLRRKLVKWLTVLVGALVTLFLIPETFTQVMRTIEEATAVSESNQRTLNSTFNVKVNYYWFYWLMKGNLVPMRFVSHLTKVHGAIFVITIMSALVLFIGTLTHLVEIHLRNANDLSKQLKHWNNLKLKGSNATLSTEALLTFRRQTRLLTEFAEQLSVVLGPMIVIATASNLAMLLGSIGWVFDGYTLLSDPLRHGSWLAFVVARGVIASNLCITSTEKVRFFGFQVIYVQSKLVPIFQ